MQLIKFLLLLILVVGMALLSFAGGNLSAHNKPKNGRCSSGLSEEDCRSCCESLKKVMDPFGMEKAKKCFCVDKVSEPKYIIPRDR
jgi:hypothetical protein